jgi:chemotaxis protein MotA
MFSIIGILVVIGAVLGGFLMEKGPLPVLVQPSELVTIAGAAIGTLLLANPMHVIKGIGTGVMGAFTKPKFPRQRYLDMLKMLFDLFSKARKEGLVAIEGDIEEADKSPLFKRSPVFLKDHMARNFVCDTMRMAITGGVSTFDVDQLMELDLEVHQHSAEEPTHALNTVADALPGLGIVAAVLGIIVTMGALGGPPAEIGKKVAAALVGTFLGILLCYGFVGPLASSMSKRNGEEHGFYQVLRVVMLSFIKGMSPILAVEMGRRAIPAHVRPSFDEVEKVCRAKAADPAPAKAQGKAK